MQVNILEAKNRLSQLIKSAQAGEEVIIANRGAPVARLVPAGRVAATATERGAELMSGIVRVVSFRTLGTDEPTGTGFPRWLTSSTRELA